MRAWMLRGLVVVVVGVGSVGMPAAASAVGTWNPQSYLASPLREATGPSVAVATTGAAVAGWQAQQGSFADVDAFVAARASGTAPFATGGTRQGVESSKAHYEGDMGMTTAVNAAGKAVVAWVQATYTGNFRVQAVVRPAGSTTFGPVQTLTAEGADAALPAVAINAAGAAVLVWRRYDSATNAWPVQGAMLTAAGTTFTAMNAGGNVATEATDALKAPVRVAVAPSGAAVVAWDSTSALHTELARWALRGPGETAFSAAHDLGAITREPDVAAGDDGSFALTWITGSGGGGATVSLARASTGDFGAPTTVVTSPGSAISTNVGLDATGNAIVATVATSTADAGAKLRVGVTTCATTCPPVSWLTDTSQGVDSLDLAVNAAGDAVAVWTRANLIEGSLLAHGASWDPPVFVSTAGQNAYVPTVGIDAGGNVIAAWNAANVALYAVRQATGAVAGATAPPGPPAGGGGSGDPSGGGTAGTGGTGGTGGGTTPPASLPQPPADTTLAAAVKQPASLTATAAGRFAGPKVTCSEPAGQACKVTVSFTTPGPKPKKGKKAKDLVVGSAKLTVAAGRSATPTITLAKAAKALLAAKRKLTLTGTVVVTDAAGNTRTFKVKVSLKAPAKKRRAGH
jgi:hypothetical protein